MNKLDTLRKGLAKKNIMTEMNEPTHWICTGNAAMNYRLSGRIDVGLPNKRSLLLWGQSGVGKSYLASNITRNAQAEGYKIVYVDSEESISEDYMGKVGIDMTPDWFVPVLVDTIEECTEALSIIFSTFDENDKFILVIDSLAGLMSDKEWEEFEKGESKGDMGQISKKLKLMVKNINKKIADHDAFCVMTTHAYQNQDPLNGEGPWICTGGKGFQFFPSFSIKLDKAKLKEGQEVKNGVRIKAEVSKTRFTAPFQKFELKVPYDKGLDLTDGLLDILEEEGTVNKNGGWYNFEYNGETIKFQKSNFMDHYDKIMELYAKEDLEETVSEDQEPEVEGE